MRYRHLSLIAALLLLLPSLGFAHSLERPESDLREREKYFQPLSRPAPPFTLQDASGSAVASSVLHGKVVIQWQETVKQQRSAESMAARQGEHR